MEKSLYFFLPGYLKAQVMLHYFVKKITRGNSLCQPAALTLHRKPHSLQAIDNPNIRDPNRKTT